MLSRYRWVIVTLISIITLINYIDRSAVAYATAPITQALHINDAQWGVIGSAFSIGYLLLAFFGGALVDRQGPKKVWSYAASIWSLVTIATALASSFASLFVIRVLLGASEGPGFPAATRATSRWLPGHERGRALGVIVGVGVPFSLMIGGPIITQLLGHFGWHWTFVILGAVGLIWVVFWRAMFREQPSEHPKVNQAERDYIAAGLTAQEQKPTTERIQWASLFGNVNLWMVALGYFAWGYMFWAFMFWLPGYLGQAFHLNLYAVGAFTVLPWAAATAGAIVGGVLVDKLFKRNPRHRSRFIVMGVALLLAGLSLIPIIVSPSLTTAMIFISLGVGFGMVTGPLWWVTSIDAAPDQPAVAAGFVDAAFALSGIVAPAVMGFIAQATGSFSSGFAVMAVLAIIGAGGLLFATREREAMHHSSTASAQAE